MGSGVIMCLSLKGESLIGLIQRKGLLTESIVISHFTKYTIPNEVFECACKLS